MLVMTATRQNSLPGAPDAAVAPWRAGTPGGHPGDASRMKRSPFAGKPPEEDQPPRDAAEALSLLEGEAAIDGKRRAQCARLLRDALVRREQARDKAQDKAARLEEALGEAGFQVQALRTALSRVKDARRASRQAFDRHLGVFEKFREAIAACQRMKSLDDLPDALPLLKAILDLPHLGLVLCEEEFGEFVPQGVATAPASVIARELSRLPGGPDAVIAQKPPYLGLIGAVPSPDFFLGAPPDAPLREGSCLIRPLRDKYRPKRLTGAVSFADPDPGRYAPEKATHFLELFCETLSGVLQDVKNHDRIVREAVRDELTGTHNRTYFNRHAAKLLQFAERKGLPACLLFIDLDRFKAVNDALGHEAGDRALAAAAGRIGGMVRKYDLFARLGGDEFVILSPGASVGDATALAARIRREIEALSLADCCGVDTTLSISASAGVAAWSPGMSPEELIRLADERMYAAKRGDQT